MRNSRKQVLTISLRLNSQNVLHMLSDLIFTMNLKVCSRKGPISFHKWENGILEAKTKQRKKAVPSSKNNEYKKKNQTNGTCKHIPGYCKTSHQTCIVIWDQVELKHLMCNSHFIIVPYSLSKNKYCLFIVSLY